MKSIRILAVLSVLAVAMLVSGCSDLMSAASSRASGNDTYNTISSGKDQAQQALPSQDTGSK